MGIRIERNKRIGRVIFFVEGDVDEPDLLKAVFCDVLGYRAIIHDKRDNSVHEYGKDDDRYSKIFVVTMPRPSIKHLPGTKRFLDEMYARLSAFGLQHDEASIFYLFDRDYQSNTPQDVIDKIDLLRNPLDNGPEMAGALLLSYPCLQAYYCQAHQDDARFQESDQAKKHVNRQGIKSVNEGQMLCAASDMLNKVERIRGKELNLRELNDYSQINRPVYEYEERCRMDGNHEFLTLSLLSMALIDLGILVFDE